MQKLQPYSHTSVLAEGAGVGGQFPSWVLVVRVEEGAAVGGRHRVIGLLLLLHLDVFLTSVDPFWATGIQSSDS